MGRLRTIGRLRAGGNSSLMLALIASLFGAGEQGAIYDNSDLSSMWQDSAGTTPAAVDQPVGKQLDKSGRGNHRTQGTSASRPILRFASGKYYLEFDGFDDSLSTAAIPFTASYMAYWFGVENVASSTTALVAELSPVFNSNSGSFALFASTNNAGDWGFAQNTGGTAGAKYTAVQARPHKEVVSCGFDGAAGGFAGITPRVNTVTPSSTNFLVAPSVGAFGNYALYFGRRGGSSLPFAGNEYSAIVRGSAAATTAAQILAGETYANTMTGAY